MKRLYLVDIDGVLADYAGALCKFHNDLVTVSGEFKSLKPSQIVKIPFNEHLKYDKEFYDALKHLFRRTGAEALTPKALKGSVEFMKKVYNRGDKVIIWTSRPVKEYPNLVVHTEQWLKKNKIPYHELLFVNAGFDKEFMLMETPGLIDLRNRGWSISIVDDRVISPHLKEYVDRIYLMNQPYNKRDKGSHFTRINKLTDILKHERNNKTRNR